jgi:hypothetical protein
MMSTHPVITKGDGAKGNATKHEWGRLVIFGLSAILLLMLVSSTATAQSTCKKAKGTVSLQAVTGPACTSSVGICATGTYKGSIAGTSNAIALKTTGSGEFAETDTLIAGTGAWFGATGSPTATGAFTASGGGEGVYSGEICQG